MSRLASRARVLALYANAVSGLVSVINQSVVPSDTPPRQSLSPNVMSRLASRARVLALYANAVSGLVSVINQSVVPSDRPPRQLPLPNVMSRLASLVARGMPNSTTPARSKSS